MYCDNMNYQFDDKDFILSNSKVKRDPETGKLIRKGDVTMEYWQPEFYDVHKVVESGAVKHGADNYLKPDGGKMSIADNSKSMAHHLLDYRAGIEADHDSGEHPLLHIACRALMGYTRWKRGIVNPEDIKVENKVEVSCKPHSIFVDFPEDIVYTGDLDYPDSPRNQSFLGGLLKD